MDCPQDRLSWSDGGGEIQECAIAANPVRPAKLHVCNDLALRRRLHGVDREDREELVSARVVSLRGRVYRDPDGLRRRDLGPGRYGDLKREQQERETGG